MAGEPILIARNCALVILGEPGFRELADGFDVAVLGSLTEAIGAPVLDRSDADEFVVDDALRASVAEMNRRSLILCGGLLEGAVTQVALSFLLEGYDVYVCADQVVCGDPEREAMYLDRIRYCAGHIVTARQIILELLSQEKEQAARAPLEALLTAGAAG